jgi:glutathionylspermidine synthase
VRLIDVLLRPEVLVFEPLWTVIPGNKAILPVLWSLFPIIAICWIPILWSTRAGGNRLCGEAYFRPLRQQYRPDWPAG